jgi:hypothetical protein
MDFSSPPSTCKALHNLISDTLKPHFFLLPSKHPAPHMSGKFGQPTLTKRHQKSQACWYIPEIPALGKHKEEDQKFKANLGYSVRP